jgi:hypothetical protein
MAMTSTQRSKARFARAAAVIAPIPLDADDGKALAAVLSVRGGSAAALVRTLLREEHARLAKRTESTGPG